MTPQQERIQQAERHEQEARVCRAGRGVMRCILGLTGDKLRRYTQYLERTARQNRRAYRRNAS